jgi:gliding motility-associated-like protein
MGKYYIRILVLLLVSNTFNLMNACTYVINKTIIQPTCGSNGLLSFSMTPPPSGGANYRVYKDGQFLVSINGSIANLNSLTPGTYKVVVTDNSSGCKDSLDNIVLDPAANALSATYYIDTPSCDTSTNGRLALKIKNASTGTITYAWRKDGNPFTNNDSIVKPAMKGKYAVTITDAANCRFEIDNMEIHELLGKMLAIDTIVFPTSCDSPNGKITINISARHYDPFNWQKKIKYTWLNRPDRDTFNFIDSLPAGKYTLVVTDSLKCYPLEIKDIEIKQNPKPKAVIRGTDTLCANIGFGKLEAFVTLGDSMNIKYYWNQGQNTKVVEGSSIVAGDYECIVEDLAGCVDTARWTIHPYPEKFINIVPEYKEILKLTPQMLRIDSPIGLYNIVWSSNPALKYDLLSNKDSVIRSNNVTENTTYFVVANYGPNCETKNNITIKVIDKMDAIKDENIPNIFTPGPGNIKNTIYKLINLDNNGGSVKLFNSFEFKVYDRWGNLIFNSDKETFEWNGTDVKGEPAMSGIYTYLMKYSTVARPFDIQLRKGTILLER